MKLTATEERSLLEFTAALHLLYDGAVTSLPRLNKRERAFALAMTIIGAVTTDTWLQVHNRALTRDMIFDATQSAIKDINGNKP